MPFPDGAGEDNPRAYLDSLILHGIKLGLQNISAMMEASGQPHLSRPVIHVAGTNGKGSVLAFLASILNASGYRVGRFTSPHLLDVTERFLLDGVPMPEAALRENVAWFQQVAEATGQVPTFFELNTAMAFRWFDQQKVDVALIEVGMGGRFDSTNIVAPLACAITNIDYDHMQYLGDTLEKIAFEKAGILKPGVPAVVGVTDAGAMSVIEKQARELDTPLFAIDKEYTFSSEGTPWIPELEYQGLGMHFQRMTLGLAGRHQPHNAAIAMSLALLVQHRFPRITGETIREGLQTARWPGRLERVLDDLPVIMDAAHNTAGCRAVADAFKEKCVVVFSVSSDKDAAGMIDILADIADPLILTAYQGERALPLQDLSACAGDHRVVSIPLMADALEQGMRLVSGEKPLLITGSIYGAGEARRILMECYGARPVVFR